MARASLILALASLLALAACTTTSPTPSNRISPTPLASPSPSRTSYPQGSLAAFLAGDEGFSIFMALMERDGFLLDRLLANPDTSFTLFLPTNEAFESLTPATKAALEADLSLITGIIERHFLPRRLASADFATAFVFSGMSRRASRLALVVDGDLVWFGDANVIETDLHVAAGLVHVIDGVNLGPTPDRRPIP